VRGRSERRWRSVCAWATTREELTATAREEPTARERVRSEMREFREGEIGNERVQREKNTISL